MTIPVSTATIRAVFSPSGPPRQKSGIAVVEISESDTFLTTGSERIRIVLPDTVSLQNGQQVRYAASGETLQLTVLPENATQKKALPAGIFTLSGIETAVVNAPPVTLTTHGLQSGIYLYDSIEAIRMVTGGTIDEKTLSLLRKKLNTEGVLALHVTSVADNDTAKAVLWPTEELPAALKQLVSSFSSRLFSSLSPGQLAALLVDRGNLPFKPLLRLDRLFQSADTTFPALRAGSTEAQQQSTTQWLHNVLAHDLSAEDHLSLAPVTTAGTMMDELEPALSAALTLSKVPRLSAEHFTAPSPATAPNETGANLLPSFAERIGLTLEHVLASGNHGGKVFAPQDSLKSVLLHLLSLTDPDVNHSTTGRGAPSQSSVQQQPDIAAALQTRPPGTASPLTANLTSLRNDVLMLLKAEALYAPAAPPPLAAGELSPGTPTDTAYRIAGPSPSAVPEEPRKNNSIAQVLRTAVIGLAKETVQLLDTVASGTGDRPAPSLPQQVMTAQTAQTLKEALTALLNRFTNRPAAFPTDLPGAQAASPSPQQGSEPLQVVLNNVLEAIDSFHRPETPAHPNPLPGERSAVSNEQHQPDVTGNNSRPDNGTFSPQAIARSLGTALDRLESLQLLARQVPTTQGTQQIIALPIKFGDAWTEINVRFLHKKKKHSAGRKKQQTTVAVDVAPPVLGSIHATMNYRPAQGLQLSIAFERNGTRKWFVNNREAFHEALLQCGIPSVRVELQQARRIREPDDQKATSDDTIIDMKV